MDVWSDMEDKAKNEYLHRRVEDKEDRCGGQGI